MKQIEQNIWQETVEGKIIYYTGDHGNFSGPYDSVAQARENAPVVAVLKPVKLKENNNDEDNQDIERSEESEG